MSGHSESKPIAIYYEQPSWFVPLFQQLQEQPGPEAFSDGGGRSAPRGGSTARQTREQLQDARHGFTPFDRS